jgi:protein-S-isoprenylcysteine O-methyltransferase Ste14
VYFVANVAIYLLMFVAHQFIRFVWTLSQKAHWDQQFISAGLYCAVCHPVYFGLLVLFIATPLALGSFWTLLLVPLPFAALAAPLQDEEKFLLAPATSPIAKESATA